MGYRKAKIRRVAELTEYREQKTVYGSIPSINVLPNEVNMLIVSFVCRAAHFFLASVSREWYYLVHDFRERNGMSWNFTVPTEYFFTGYGVLDWATDNGYVLSRRSAHLASIECDPDVVKYIHDEGFGISNNCYIAAAKNGDLRLVKWLYENGCQIHKKTTKTAAEYGHIDVLRYLNTIKPLGNKAMNGAMLSDKIKIVDYLHFDLKMPVTFENISNAVAAGNICMMDYVMKLYGETNDEENVSLTHTATCNGHVDLIRHMSDIGIFKFKKIECQFAQDLKTLRYLHESGCKWGKLFIFKMIHKPDCLRYAMEEGCPYRENSIKNVITNVFLEDKIGTYRVLCEWQPQEARDTKEYACLYLKRPVVDKVFEELGL